jgi:hypothetical protein
MSVDVFNKSEFFNIYKNIEFEILNKKKGRFDICCTIASNDKAFLEETWKLVAEYTRKIDPLAEIGEMKIENLGEEEYQNLIDPEEKERFYSDTSYDPKVFNYGIHLDSLLPRLVKTLYGNNPVNTYKGNCHGAALVAAGIFPIMRYLEYPVGLVDSKIHEISIKELGLGDVVYLQSMGRGKGDHSFVFLDHNISLSMNGSGEALSIYRTGYILKYYHFPSDVLKENFLKTDENNKIWEKEITILRKNDNWKYPEPILRDVISFYEIVKESGRYTNYHLPTDRNYFRIEAETAVKKIQSFVLETINNPETEPELRSAWRKMYKPITDLVPFHMSESLYSLK